MNLHVEKVDHEDAGVRERLFEFMAPHEPYCLFITGNLKSGFPDSHIYVARRGAEWVGVAGYYGGPKAAIPFALDPDAARALARHIAGNHSPISFLNAIASVAEPAYDEIRRFGYEVRGDPHQVFMQLDGEPALQPHEESVRPVAPADYEAVARLLRHLRGRPVEPPVTEGEIRKVSTNPRRRVLVVDGQVVSTASTNGVGISAFQILGVATHHEHRSKGYARAVCASLIREMRRAGARQTIIFTGRSNVPARRCYEGLGFRTTGDYWVAELMRTPSDP